MLWTFQLAILHQTRSPMSLWFPVRGALAHKRDKVQLASLMPAGSQENQNPWQGGTSVSQGLPNQAVEIPRRRTARPRLLFPEPAHRPKYAVLRKHYARPQICL